MTKEQISRKLKQMNTRPLVRLTVVCCFVYSIAIC